MKSWPARPGDPLHLDMPRGLAALVLALGVGLLLSAVGLVRQNRNLEAELGRVASELETVTQRERDLEDAVVQQHKKLQETEAELETTRFQIATIELQLDGIDVLTNQIRQQLGMEPGTGTWDPAALQGAAPSGQGGPGPAAADAERITQAQRRLVQGLEQLYALAQIARERGGAPAQAGAAPAYSIPENWPARGPVTSAFGWRVFRDAPNYHTGIDIGLPYGSAVLATGDGIVLGSGWQPSYGWSVLIQHAEGYHSLYAHLSKTLVEVGDTVAVADLVGLSGNSGNSTGPHLHYEIWKDGRVLNPRPLMDGTGGATR